MLILFVSKTSHTAFILYVMRSLLIIGVIAFGLLCIYLNSCGPKVSSSDSSCYQIVGDEVIYTCNNDSPENPRANTGYTGPYNPKALDLYRPGRFENINAPGW
jgi:hypothetical protein